jgi:hypothetical protein
MRFVQEEKGRFQMSDPYQRAKELEDRNTQLLKENQELADKLAEWEEKFSGKVSSISYSPNGVYTYIMGMDSGHKMYIKTGFPVGFGRDDSLKRRGL